MPFLGSILLQNQSVFVQNVQHHVQHNHQQNIVLQVSTLSEEEARIQQQQAYMVQQQAEATVRNILMTVDARDRQIVQEASAHIQEARSVADRVREQASQQQQQLHNYILQEQQQSSQQLQQAQAQAPHQP